MWVIVSHHLSFDDFEVPIVAVANKQSFALSCASSAQSPATTLQKITLLWRTTGSNCRAGTTAGVEIGDEAGPETVAGADIGPEAAAGVQIGPEAAAGTEVGLEAAAGAKAGHEVQLLFFCHG